MINTIYIINKLENIYLEKHKKEIQIKKLRCVLNSPEAIIVEFDYEYNQKIITGQKFTFINEGKIKNEK